MTEALMVQITLDCADPHVLAEWWSATIGWPVEPTDQDFIRSMVDAGHATEADTRIYNGKLVWATGAAISVPNRPRRRPMPSLPLPGGAGGTLGQEPDAPGRAGDPRHRP